MFKKKKIVFFFYYILYFLNNYCFIKNLKHWNHKNVVNSFHILHVYTSILQNGKKRGLEWHEGEYMMPEVSNSVWIGGIAFLDISATTNAEVDRSTAQAVAVS